MNTGYNGSCAEPWKLDPSGKVRKKSPALGKDKAFVDEVDPGPGDPVAYCAVRRGE